MTLTHLQITNAHLQITNAKPRETAHKLPDTAGLYLVVQPTGAKLWRMNYRYLGRQKTLHFGSWPAVGIAAARERRDEARKQLAAGLDPAAEKRAAMLARKVAADNTFKMIAEEWVAKNEREGRAPITLDKIRWLLGMAYPKIGTGPISEITVQEVLAVLRSVEATGRYESARRMRSEEAPHISPRSRLTCMWVSVTVPKMKNSTTMLRV